MGDASTSTQDLHPEGRCGFDFLTSNKVVTCGKDGLVRIVSIDPLEDGGYGCHDDGNRQFVKIATNSACPNQFALAKEEDGFNSFVQLYQLSTGEEGTHAEPTVRLTQTNLGICDVSWSKSGTWMAVGTDSDGIRVMKVADPVASIVQLKDHQGAVKGVEFDPSEQFLASIGADGSLRIFSLEGNNWTCIKHKQKFCERDNGGSSDYLRDCKPAWSEDGSLLAVPGSKSIRILKRGDWDEEVQFENADFPSTVTLTAFSPSRLVACCGVGEGSFSNKLVIWNLRTRKVEFSFERFDQPYLRCLRLCVDQAKKLERLVAMDAHGQMVQYELPMSSLVATSSSPVLTATAKKDATDEEEEIAPTLRLDSSQLVDDEENVPSESNKNKTEDESLLKLKETMGFNEDGQALAKPTSTSNQLLQQMSQEDDYNNADLFAPEEAEEDDDHHPRHHPMDDTVVADLKEEIAMLRHNVRTLLPPAAPKSFQPGSTVFPPEDDATEDDPNRRFLAWNQVGSIVCRKDREHQSIEIDFADMTLHRPIRFTDLEQLSMAAMSESGVLFASSLSGSSRSRLSKADNEDEDDDDDLQNSNDAKRDAVVRYRAFNSPWSSSANWKFTLPKKEDVIAVACGNEFCVAATSKGFLRIFRPSGLQEPIVLAPGSVVSMTAAGSLLLVLFHTTQRQSDYEMGYQLIDFGREEQNVQKEFKILACGTLPCSKAVTWCGFADESLGYMPLVYRKDGTLLGLSAAMNWTWVVLADGSGLDRGVKLWPISASRQGGLLAVALRHKRKQPSVIPRSTSALFPIRIPILRDNYKQKSLKYENEETQMQDVIALEQRKWSGLEEEIVRAEAKLDVATLKALIVAIKMNEYARAIGLASRFRLTKSLEVALDKATEADANADFLEKLVQMVDERKRVDEMAEEEQEEEEAVSRAPKRQRKTYPEEEVNNEEAEDDEVQPVSQQRVSSSSAVRVGFSKHPEAPSSDDGEDDDNNQPLLSSPVMDKKRSVMPPNPFLKSASPATRDKRSQQRTTPIRLPELSRQASFTVEAREQYKRRL